MVDPHGLSGGLRVVFVPLGFALGALLCRIWLAHPPAAYAFDLAQPLAVVTYWQRFGFLMWVALFLAVAIASVGYIAALNSSTPLRMTIMMCALACGAALAFPVVFSSDAYAYALYGWMSLHGLSPYAHAAIAARSPLSNAALWQWGNPPPVCVYGTAFVWFSELLVAGFAHFGVSAALWSFRIAACASLVLCAPLAYAAFPGRARAAAAAGIALNPIAIWCCAEGHNDVYVLAIALAGFALVRRSRAFAGAALLALSGLVKIPGLIAAAAATLAYWRDARFSRMFSGAAAGLAICILIGLPALAQLTRNASRGHYYFPQFSLQYVLATVLGDSAGVVLTAALVLACAGLGTVLAVKRNEDAPAVFALAVWFAIPNPYPWYTLWILPLAFLGSAPARSAIVALTLFTMLRYLPDATTDIPAAPSDLIALAPIAAAAAAWAVTVNANKRPAEA